MIDKATKDSSQHTEQHTEQLQSADITLSITLHPPGDIESHIPLNLEKTLLLFKLLEQNISRMITERFTPPKDRLQIVRPILNKFLHRS